MSASPLFWEICFNSNVCLFNKSRDDGVGGMRDTQKTAVRETWDSIPYLRFIVISRNSVRQMRGLLSEANRSNIISTDAQRILIPRSFMFSVLKLKKQNSIMSSIADYGILRRITLFPSFVWSILSALTEYELFVFYITQLLQLYIMHGLCVLYVCEGQKQLQPLVCKHSRFKQNHTKVVQPKLSCSFYWQAS